jgi:hypothetical protein
MTIVALAGRRIDAPESTTPRFPATKISFVSSRIRSQLERIRATGLVCSAACGADLLALSEAGQLGIKRRIVLPFDRTRFRTTSVTDRPGDPTTDWGTIFDQVVKELAPSADVVTLNQDGSENAYAAANVKILSEAQDLAQQTGVDLVAVRVWEGDSRGEGDLTEAFGDEARERGLPVLDVLTT